MELVLYTIISWVVITYLITTIQNKELIRSIIIYFIFTMLILSSFSLISLNWQLIHPSEDKTKFLSHLMSSTIIMPLLVLIFINSYYKLTTNKKIIPIIILMLLISLLEFTNLKLQIYTYVKWSFGLMFLTEAIFVLIILIISKYINVIQQRSEDN